jgi:hypothetical protein
MPFVLGHALSRKALPGGTATHDRIDAQKSAGLLRGGLLPQADVYPSERRATRDLLRRRIHFRRKRAEWLTQVQQPNSQDHRPAIGKQLASQANRDGVAARCPTPAGQQRIAGDLALMGHDDHRLRDVELAVRTTAKPHQAHTLDLRRPGPGIGAMLSLGLLYEIHPLERFPRVHEFVSDGRLVTCAKASAGKR